MCQNKGVRNQLRIGSSPLCSSKLVRATGEQLEQQRQEAWIWKGRTVKIVDGTTVTMPDTFVLPEVG